MEVNIAKLWLKNVSCPYTNNILVYKVCRTHGKHKEYIADFRNEELVCLTALLEQFHKNSKRTIEALENLTLNWQTPAQVSSTPLLKYFSCP